MASVGSSSDEESRAERCESSEWADENGERVNSEEDGWEEDGLDTGNGETEENEEDDNGGSSDEDGEEGPAREMRPKFSKSQRRAAKRRKALRLVKAVVMS